MHAIRGKAAIYIIIATGLAGIIGCIIICMLALTLHKELKMLKHLVVFLFAVSLGRLQQHKDDCELACL